MATKKQTGRTKRKFRHGKNCSRKAPMPRQGAGSVKTRKPGGSRDISWLAPDELAKVTSFTKQYRGWKRFRTILKKRAARLRGQGQNVELKGKTLVFGVPNTTTKALAEKYAAAA